MPLLVGTLVALAIMLPGLYVWRSHQVKEGAEAFAERAEELAKEESWAESAEYLFLYLRMRPDDANARIELAETFEHVATGRPKLARAIELYYQALAVAPKERKRTVRLRLVELLNRAGEFASAEVEVNKLLHGDRNDDALDGDPNNKRLDGDPNDPKANRLLALALYQKAQSESPSAVARSGAAVGTALEKALRLNPTDVQLAIDLADVYRNKPHLQSTKAQELNDEQRFELADKCLDEVVKANPDQAIAHLARYQYRSQNDLPGADEDLDRAIQLEPENLVVLLASGQNRLQKVAGRTTVPESERRQLLDEAGQYYQKAIEASEKLEQAYLGLGEVRALDGKVDEALQTWQSGLKHCGESSIALNLRLAAAYISQNDTAHAKQCISTLKSAAARLRQRGFLESDLGFARVADVLSARIALANQETEKAVEILRQVTNDPVSRQGNAPPAYQAFMLLGSLYASQGQHELAMKAYDEAALVDPKSAEPRLAAAALWMNLDRAELAEDQLRKAVAIENTAENRILLTAAEIRHQLTVPAKQRDWSKVERLLAAAKETKGRAGIDESWRVSLLEAQYLLRRAEDNGDPRKGLADAMQVLKAAREAGIRSAEGLASVASMFERLGDAAEADHTLAELQKAFPAEPRAYITSASILAARKQFDAAHHILDEGLGKVQVDRQLPLRLGIVSVFLLEEREDEAWKTLSDFQQKDPANRSLLERTLELALELKRYDDAEVLEKSLSELPGVSPIDWKVYRARRLLSQASGPQDDRLTEAQQIVAEICKQRPTSPLGQMLLGDVLDRQGKPEKAIEAYEKAIQFGEQRVAVFERLTLLLYQLGRFNDANKYLDKLGSRAAASTRLSTVDISMAVRSGEPARALDVARRGVARRPNDPLAYIWLGQLLVAADKPAEAEGALRRAIEVAPTDPRAYGAAINYFIRTKKLDRARAAVEQCARKVEAPPAQREMILAAGYQAIGDHDQALAHFQQAEKLDPQNAELQEGIASILLTADPPVAEKALRRAIELNPQSERARRMLAELLANRGGEQRWQEALALLDKTTIGENPTASNKRLEALLLARRGGAENLAKSQQILQELRSGSDATADRGDQLLLALVEEAQGDRELARKKYLELVSNSSPRAKDLAAYVDFLLRHDESKTATTWLDRLEQLDPYGLNTLKLRLRWLNAENRTAEIEPLLESTAQQALKTADPNGRPGREQKLQVCQMIGDLYVFARSFAGAERWYRRAYEIDSQQYGRLARALAELGRSDEAVRLCSKAATTDSSRGPATSVVAIMLRGQVDPSVAKEAESLISKSLAAHSDDAALLSAVGALRVVQNRLEDASALYRKLLDLLPQNVEVLNNLATVLAETPDQAGEALKYIDRAISIGGSQPNLLDTKGTILVALGRIDEGIELLNSAASAPNADPRYYLHLAVGHYRAGDVGKAREALEFAKKHELARQILTESDTKMLAELDEHVRQVDTH